MHLLAVTALHWSSAPVPLDAIEVVDLTVLNMPRGSDTASNKLSSPSRPPIKINPSVNAPSSESADAKTSSSDGAQEGPSNPTSTSGSEFGGGTASYSEITRFPKVKKEIKAQYPEEAKKSGIDGPVVLEIIIDKLGQVREVQLISGPGHGLNESAIEALKKFEFQPAFKGEESVAVKIRYTYRFKLEVN
ncbi:energy transducer TonB [Bdellovibrio bacteriovorus]|uniref:Energy transducer TonB n=1 Tax=Bdellovibrio bacteriovorus TaxID=959 RepID=A0A150WGX3_BDEBC|nr:energy transducer TonB [Bdellovibrio bacteriovorus]